MSRNSKSSQRRIQCSRIRRSALSMTPTARLLREALGPVPAKASEDLISRIFSKRASDKTDNHLNSILAIFLENFSVAGSAVGGAAATFQSISNSRLKRQSSGRNVAYLSRSSVYAMSALDRAPNPAPRWRAAPRATDVVKFVRPAILFLARLRAHGSVQSAGGVEKCRKRRAPRAAGREF